MKKILICMLLTALLGASALAEAVPGDFEALALDNGDVVAFDQDEALYKGAWVPFEDGFRLYLPAAWRAFELTDEQREAGLFYRAGSDGDAAMGVAVSYARAEALQTLADLEDDFRAAGFTGVARRFVNGLWTVGFVGPGSDFRGAAFYHPAYPGYVLMVFVAPLGADGSPEAAVGRAILDSLSPMPDAP